METRPLKIDVIERVEADPAFRRPAEWLRALALDRVPMLDARWQARRWIGVDTGHYTRGRPLSESLWRCDARRMYRWPFDGLDLVAGDLPRPERRGPVLAVARRDVLARALAVIGADLVAARVRAWTEVAGQLQQIAERRDKDDPAATGGELAMAALIALWKAARRLPGMVR